MRRGELTFDIVDDLVAAHARGRLAAPSGDGFSPARIGPMIELLFEGHDGRSGPLLKSAWLDAATQADLRVALRSAQNPWLDAVQHRGFLRTVFDPLQARDGVARTQFLMAARKGAETVGFPVATAQSLAAAIREMESNVHEHSDRAATGIIAFQARAGDFEFVPGLASFIGRHTFNDPAQILRSDGAVVSCLHDSEKRFSRFAVTDAEVEAARANPNQIVFGPMDAKWRTRDSEP